MVKRRAVPPTASPWLLYRVSLASLMVAFLKSAATYHPVGSSVLLILIPALMLPSIPAIGFSIGGLLAYSQPEVSEEDEVRHLSLSAGHLARAVLGVLRPFFIPTTLLGLPLTCFVFLFELGVARHWTGTANAAGASLWERGMAWASALIRGASPSSLPVLGWEVVLKAMSWLAVGWLVLPIVVLLLFAFLTTWIPKNCHRRLIRSLE